MYQPTAADLADEERFVAMCKRSMIKEEAARKYYMQRRQEEAARQLGRNRKAIDGLGEVVLEVDTETYEEWAWKFAKPDANGIMTPDYSCWKDKDFVRMMKRDNPSLKVDCTGTKIQSGWRPEGHGTRAGVVTATAESSKRFHKNYGA